MESTFNDSGKAIRADANVRSTGSQEVRNLMADMQDLLDRVAHVADPEIARLRAKIERGLATAKKTLADGTS
jgi:ElaB/YqjD/DUF883 family membrane-anchored ribosome-binding protein